MVAVSLSPCPLLSSSPDGGPERIRTSTARRRFYRALGSLMPKPAHSFRPWRAETSAGWCYTFILVRFSARRAENRTPRQPVASIQKHDVAARRSLVLGVHHNPVPASQHDRLVI